MSSSGSIAKNFLSLSFAEIVTRIAGFVVSIFVARILGAGAFGELSFAIAVTSYFALFSDFGLTTLGMKEISQDKKVTNSLGTNILSIQLVISAILLVVLILVLSMVHLDYRIKLVTFLFGLTIFPSALNMAYILQAHEKMGLVALSKIISQIGYVVVGLALIFYARTIVVLPIVSIVAGVFGSAFALWALHRHLKFVFSSLDWQIIKRIGRQAWPFVLTAFMIQLYLNIDSIMLQFFKGENQVGYYNAAYKIILLIFSVLTLTNATLFPVLSRLSLKREEFVRALSQATKWLGVISVPAAVGGILLAPQIILFVFGKGYEASVLPLQILLVYPLFKFLGASYEIALVVSDHIKQVTMATTAAAFINLALNFWLIPVYGIAGAAIATIAAEVVSLAIQWLYFHKTWRFDISRVYIAKPVIASLAMLALLLFLPHSWPLPILVILGGAVYGGALLLIGGIRFQELRMLVHP